MFRLQTVFGVIKFSVERTFKHPVQQRRRSDITQNRVQPNRIAR